MDCCATYTCEEIVIEILSRLPAKSLVRFMAVCRLWKSIITSPQFRLVSKTPTKLLVHTTRQCYTLDEESRLMFEGDFPLKLYSDDHRAVVIGSDNGLLCIRICLGGRYCGAIIWNPFIRKHVVIPDDPKEENIICIIEYDYGFGGTISGGDYKYVRFVGLLDGEGSLKEAVYIYSLKAGTWRRRRYPYSDDMSHDVCLFSPSSVLLRGRLHWFCNCTYQIFSFDLEDEVFKDIFRVHESIQNKKITGLVTVIKESLAVIANEIGRQYYAVWVMEKYGDVNSWINLCNIDLTKENLFVHDTVHLLKDGDLLLGLFKKKHPFKQKLVTYNPKTMKTRELGGGGSSSLLTEVCGFTKNYKESLVLLGDDYHASADQPTLQDRRQHGHFPVRTGGASSYPFDHNSPMFFHEPATFFLGYYPVWTGGPGFQWYPLFQDQYGSCYAWTGFNWLHVIYNYNPFVPIQ